MSLSLVPSSSANNPQMARGSQLAFTSDASFSPRSRHLLSIIDSAPILRACFVIHRLLKSSSRNPIELSAATKCQRNQSATTKVKTPLA